ncbi:MAG TPA: flagellar FlbD family protein [Spirochaetales bacterium]|nr:flagellar FlbD family protein [Spirochaetales bacterium]HRY55540.1 flagellar FlbD family protein [Spirochaetia bacterium]HRZ65334.1 flagellar FlbD family protein [Spirochaetia bacterium]
MIELTQLSGKTFWLNPHQIEYVEKTPDTTITMLSGKRVVVLEKVETLLERIVAYRREIGAFKNEE